MAIETAAIDRFQKHVDNLEAERLLLSNCLNLYKTLTSHFSSLEKSIHERKQNLDSRNANLQSDSDKTLAELSDFEKSIPELESSLSLQVQEKKDAALAEFENSTDNKLGLEENLRSLCRRMDHIGLIGFVMSRRKHSTAIRVRMGSCLSECVDPARLVLDTVEEFVNRKAGGGGTTELRWACGMVASGLFSVDEVKERESVGPTFAKSTVERAAKVLKWWGEKMGDGDEGLGGTGAAEGAMFLQLVVGFGLIDRFESEFLKKLVKNFSFRTEMPKLTMRIFGEKVADIIEEFVKSEKELEAIPFILESRLTEKFQPATLIKSYLRRARNNASDALVKGNNSLAAKDESNDLEANALRAVIKCVEDNKYESEFPLDNMRRRLVLLERAKLENKKPSATSSKPSKKRTRDNRGAGPPRHRPAKAAKPSNPYPPFSHRYPVEPPSPHHQVTRYPPPPHSYPGHSPYAAVYGPNYGGSHVPATGPGLGPSPSPNPISHHYGIPGDGAGVGGAHLGGSYGAQTDYAVPGAGVGGAHLGGSYGTQVDYPVHGSAGAYPSGSYATQTDYGMPGASAGVQTGYAAPDYGTAAAHTYQPSLYNP